MTAPKAPPREVWITCDSLGRTLRHYGTEAAARAYSDSRDGSIASFYDAPHSVHRYVLAPATEREVVAYVVKQGGAYLYDYLAGDWTNSLAEAARWKVDAETGHDVRRAAHEHGGRVVALTRRVRRGP